MKRFFTSLLFVAFFSSAFCQNSDDFIELNISGLEFDNAYFFGHHDFALIDVIFTSPITIREDFYYNLVSQGTGYLITGKFGTYLGKKTYTIASVGFTRLKEDSSYPYDSNLSFFDLGVGLRHIILQKKKFSLSTDVIGQFSALSKDPSLKIFALNIQPKIGYEIDENWELNFQLSVRRSFFDFSRFEKGIGVGVLRNL